MVPILIFQLLLSVPTMSRYLHAPFGNINTVEVSDRSATDFLGIKTVGTKDYLILRGPAIGEVEQTNEAGHETGILYRSVVAVPAGATVPAAWVFLGTSKRAGVFWHWFERID